MFPVATCQADEMLNLSIPGNINNRLLITSHIRVKTVRLQVSVCYPTERVTLTKLK